MVKTNVVPRAGSGLTVSDRKRTKMGVGVDNEIQIKPVFLIMFKLFYQLEILRAFY